MSLKPHILHRAAWVLPVASNPLRDGALLFSPGGTLLEAGPFQSVHVMAEPLKNLQIIDHGAAVLFPGLVNAHLHLELSHLRARVAPVRPERSAGFVPWVEKFVSARREMEGEAAAIVSAMRDAAAELRAAGVAFVGDVSNTLVSWEILAESGIGGVVFHEVFHSPGGRRPPQTAQEIFVQAKANIAALPSRAGLRASLAPHAPYTVSRELFEALRGWGEDNAAPLSLHIAEDENENLMFRDGSGAFGDWFREAGIWPWPPGFRPMGCGSAAALALWGFWGPRTLAVHGTALRREDAAVLKAAGSALCLCPRSNLYITGKTPPLRMLLEMELPLALGTDSLASNVDLNLLKEGAVLLDLAEREGVAGLTPRRIFEMMTLGGARALGLEEGRASFLKGGRPAVMKTGCPAGLDNPEEWLIRHAGEWRAEAVEP